MQLAEPFGERLPGGKDKLNRSNGPKNLEWPVGCATVNCQLPTGPPLSQSGHSKRGQGIRRDPTVSGTTCKQYSDQEAANTVSRSRGRPPPKLPNQADPGAREIRQGGDKTNVAGRTLYVAAKLEGVDVRFWSTQGQTVHS